MTRMWKGRRILSLVLALAMIITMLPSMALPIYSENTTDQATTPADTTETSADTPNYGALVGATAQFNIATYINFTVDNDPSTFNDDYYEGEWATHENYLYYDPDAGQCDFDADLTLVITDWYANPKTFGLWFKVEAAPGYTLPDMLAENPWVFQNWYDIYAEEDWEEISQDVLIITVPDGVYDAATGITVTGVPADATVSVKIPEIDGEILPDIYDIKILVSNAEGELVEWQPIDEGKTVTITMPTQYEVVKVTHIIDYAGAIRDREDLMFVPVADIDAATLALLGPAMDAYEAVYGTRDYVAVEELGPFTAENGIFSFAANSFSIYIPFDGASQNAGTDWESFQGYVDANSDNDRGYNEAKAAYEAENGNPYVYKIEKGDFLSITWGKGSNKIGEYYTIHYKNDNGEWVSTPGAPSGLFSSQTSISTPYLSVELTDRPFLSTKYDNIKFTATNSEAAEGQIFYISYYDSGSPASCKTIILEIVGTLDGETVEPNGIPLYIAIDPEMDSVFHKEPLDKGAMNGKFYWYLDGGLQPDKNIITPYADNSNALFACNAFAQSTLKQTTEDGSVSVITDYAGILTQRFINMSDTFIAEMIQRLESNGLSVNMNTHTLLIYAVKAIYSGKKDATGNIIADEYYIMCKLMPKSSAIISYYTGNPYGFNESSLSQNMPAVAIVPKNEPHEIGNITGDVDGSFTTNDGTNDYKITFLGWSSEPNPHYEDFPGEGKHSEDDHWYLPGDIIYPEEDMQLYAVWRPENHYANADIKFTCEVLDEGDNILTDRTIDFTVDSRFKDYQYVICDEMGVPQVPEGKTDPVRTFTDGDTISLKHGEFLYIYQVQTLENGEEPYTITCATPGYYASRADAVTEIWVTKAENTTGLYEVEFTAQWQKYTLTWIVDGVKTVDEHYFGDTIQSMPNPAKNGYTFTGWSTTVPQTMPDYDLTISATWKLNEYTITYDLGDGSWMDGTNGLREDEYTVLESIDLPVVVRDGYAFNGWKPKSNVGNWDSSTIYTGARTEMYGNVTLEAQWISVEYVITTIFNGGRLPDDVTYNAGYKTGDTITFYNLIRDGYRFDGWKVESCSDGNWPVGETFAAGKTISDVVGDVTLSAQWTPIEYTINYDWNGSNKDDQSYPSGYNVESSDIPIPNPTWQEHEFLGWTGTDLSEATKNLVIPTGSIGDRVYTATWGLNQYNITFVYDNGRQPRTETLNYGSTLTLPTPTWAGYEFKGWKVTSTDGDWVLDTTYEEEITVLSGDVTLTAQWELITYTISFDSKGGSVISLVKFPYNASVDITSLPVPTREGYTFDGWIVPDTVTVTDNKFNMPDRDIELTAQWTEITVVIQYQMVGPDGTTGFGSLTQTQETVAVVTGNPVGSVATASGNAFKFVGWYSDEACTVLVSANATWKPQKVDGLYEAATYYAKFEYNLTSLTITVANSAAVDNNQGFIFEIKTKTGADAVNVTVVVLNNGTVKIEGLTIGNTYTITLKNQWSWRYESESREITLTPGGQNITVIVTRKETKWLDSNGYSIKRG